MLVEMYAGFPSIGISGLTGPYAGLSSIGICGLTGPYAGFSFIGMGFLAVLLGSYAGLASIGISGLMLVAVGADVLPNLKCGVFSSGFSVQLLHILYGCLD